MFARKSTTTYVGELVITQQKHWLVGLQLEDLRLEKTDWGAVDLDETRSLLNEGHSSGGFL